MSITFQKDATIVTLPDPIPGCTVRAVRPQATGRSAGGTFYAYDKGNGRLETELRFESLTDVEKAALAALFNEIALGARNTFAYTDSGGITWTARFIRPELSFLKVCADVWDVRLPLELSIGG